MFTSDAIVEVSDDSPEQPPTMHTLPHELFVAIMARCNVTSIGRLACSCSGLADACASDDIWQGLCACQGLESIEGVSPRALLRRAAICSHAENLHTASGFHWTVPAGFDDNQLEGRCVTCGRRYRVVTKKGFVDTKNFASKLVTQALFTAAHDAPLHQRSWTAVWSRKEAMPAEEARLRAHRERRAGASAADASTACNTRTNISNGFDGAVFLGQQM